ncbi:hypothetical protein [Cognatishimia activa]|uniref:Uncharacterized protein n=1 Tax=Cognatishimia activa TaxID=1715691 RepID=A0A0N7MBE2_9RHOB|nr:hypothetical protein [Cognatishimia activa]CUI26813.1 hypothetical protein TA5113_00029 [Cognatishimia activa]CUK25160.1 hypothetical protein TA5114_00950 [Cognatishimia activa]
MNEFKDYFSSYQFQLLRAAARFRDNTGICTREPKPKDFAELVSVLMSKGYWADEFAYLDNPNLNPFEFNSVAKSFLSQLNWRPCSDEVEFRFLTASYAKIGGTNDVAAYYAIIQWMEDVGRELHNNFTTKFVADGIGAERIYGCFYSYSPVTNSDLIESIINPQTHDWIREGEARPVIVFREWIAANPDDLEIYKPIDLRLLEEMRA